MSFFRKNILFSIIILIILGDFGIVRAAFNEKINYQGKLTNPNGVAVSNGTYNVRFRLCTASDCTGGADPIWTETLCYSPDSGSTCNGTGTDQRVSVSNGLFSVLAGSVSSLAGVNFNQTLYLEVQVGGLGTAPSWETLTPRKALGAVPAAFEAKKLGGATWAAPDAIGSGNPAGGAFTALSSTGLTTVGNNSATVEVNSSSWDISTAGAMTGISGIASSGNIDFSSLSAGGMVKAAVTTGRLSIATAGTDYENPLTFSNGLTRTTNAIKLGGTLTANTDIPLGGYNLGFSGTGNVGIGTTAPQDMLHIAKDGGLLRPRLQVASDTASYRAILDFYRSHGTVGSPTLVANGDTIGGFRFVAYDGGAWREMGGIDAVVDGAPGSGDMPGVLRFFTALDGASTISEKMRINNAGNIGIGTATPTNLLSLGGTAARTIWMERNTTAATAGQGLTLSSGGAIAGTADLAGGDLTLKSGISTGTGSSAMRFYTATAGTTGTADNAPTEKMTILGSGYVGIGTAAPGANLEISTTANVTPGNGNGIYINVGGIKGQIFPRLAGRIAFAPDISVTSNFTDIFNSGSDFVYEFQSGGNIKLRAYQAPFQIETSSGSTTQPITFAPKLVEAMRITPDGNVGIGTTNPGVQAAAGRKYLTLSGDTATGVLELITQQADADNVLTGLIQFVDKNSINADKRVAVIGTYLSGTTVNNRGGYMVFNTRPDNGAFLVERMRIDRDGNVGIGNAGPLEKLQVTGNVYLDQASSRLGIGIQALTRTGVYATPTFTDSATNVYGMNILSTINNSNALYQGFRTNNTVGAGATITNNYGFYAVNPGGAGAITTNYGLYIEEMAKGSTNYAIYSAGTTDKSYFGGSVGIGDTTPDGLLDVESTGAKTTANYGINLSNLTTNATTDGINKYGAYITSTGGFLGAGGTATNNYGLYIDTVSGADNNYGAYIAGNVGIGTASPGVVTSAGRKYLTLSGDTAAGVLELITQQADADLVAAGIIQFTDKNSTAADKRVSAIVSYLSGTTANNRGGYLGFSTKPDNGTLTERMRIDKDGNVGIGTAAPTNLLSLSGTAARTIWMERNTTAATAGQGLTLSSGGAIAGTADLAGGDLTLKSGISTGTGSSAMRFYTAMAGTTGTTDRTPTEKMTILGSGNVGIGTAAPEGKLHIYSGSAGAVTVAPTANELVLEDSGSGGMSILTPNNAYGTIYFGDGDQYLEGAIQYYHTDNQLQFYTSYITDSHTTPAMVMTNTGKIGINDGTPDGWLDIEPTGATTSANYGINLNNLATSSTASINKYGAYISSTGTWNGASANNYGLYVDTPTGGTNNYAAIFAGGNVGIGTATPARLLEVSGSSGDGVMIRVPEVLNNGGQLFFSTGSGANAHANQIASIFGKITQADPLILKGELQFYTNNGDSAQLRMVISDSGNVGIGDTNPSDKRLSVLGSGAQTAAYYGTYIANTTTSSTASINKYGAYISSTGTWNGTSANNYGLYVDAPTGGTNNYAAVFAGGNVGIGTTSPGYILTLQNSGSVVSGNYSLSWLGRTGTTESGVIIGYHGNGTVSDYPIIRAGGAGALGLALGGDSTVQNALFIAAGGNVGVGDISPLSTFTVGDGDKFQVVGATGNITTAGDIAINGNDITSTGALNITPNAGSGLNISLSTTGDFAVNYNNLYVDTSTASVGIGTQSPTKTLEIVGSLPTMALTGYANGASGFGIYQARGSEGTESAPRRTLSTNSLGYYGFYGCSAADDSSNCTWATSATATIHASAAENFTSSAMGTHLVFATTPIGSTSRAERMRIDSQGNVGIGTSAPTNLLSLSGTAARTIWMERNTTAATAGQGLTLSSGGAIAGTADLAGGDLTLKSGISTGTGSSAMRFFTATAGTTGTADNAPTEKMTILGSGNVGIGTAAPGYILDVNPSTSDGNIRVKTTTGNVARLLLENAAAGGRNWDIRATQNSIAPAGGLSFVDNTAAVVRMVIDNSGNVGIGTTGPTYQLQLSTDSAGKPNGGSWANSSDMRLKTNIEPIAGELALNKILQLQGVSFDWINPEDHGNMIGAQGGFIAQDVEKVFPKWISEINPSGKDIALVGEGEKIKSLSLPFEYDAYMVEAIKEQQKQIEELKLALNPDGNVTDSSGEAIVASLGQSQSFKDLVASTVKDALKSLTGTVIAAGEWTFEKITAKKICIEDVCVNKNQLQELLDNNALKQSPNIKPLPSPQSSSEIKAGEAEAIEGVAELMQEIIPTPNVTSEITLVPTPAAEITPIPETSPTPEP